MRFCYSHLSGRCCRKTLLELFGESAENANCESKCCDVCESGLIQMEDRLHELSIPTTAIDELGNCGEVKITDWIRGGQLTWMKDIRQKEETAYGKSPKGWSKGWWRNFIRQAAATRLIKRMVKTAKFGQNCGVYASLSVDDKGRKVIDEKNYFQCIHLHHLHLEHQVQNQGNHSMKIQIWKWMSPSRKEKIKGIIYYPW